MYILYIYCFILFHFAELLHCCFPRTLPLQNFNVVVNTTG